MKLTVGIIGAGVIAQEHANSLKRIGAVGKIVVFDPDSEKARSLATNHRGTAVASLKDLVRASDVVWVCSPPFAREEAVSAACAARLPIFCEKPLALDARGLARMAGLVAKAGVPFFMGQSGRYAAFGVKMKELVEIGVIGNVRGAWSLRLGWLDPAKTPPWRRDDALGGGTLIELGVHEIDFLQWTCGNFTSVAARGVSKNGFQHSVSSIGEAELGVVLRLDVSWASPRYLWQRGVDGEEGSLFFDDARVREVVLHRPAKKPRIFRVEDWLDPRTCENTALRNQARDVIRRIVAGEAPAVTIDHGADAIRTALAMRKSAATGRTVVVSHEEVKTRGGGK